MPPLSQLGHVDSVRERSYNRCVDPAIQSMIDNLPSNTGKSLAEWFTVLDASNLDKHAALVALLKQEHGITHGYANGIVLQYRARGSTTSAEELVDAQYSGPKAELRPVYDALVSTVQGFGSDIEISPKKASVSVRRSKQFALIEPASSKRIQVGINLKGAPATDRLLASTGMCTHKVSLTSIDDIDGELVGWLQAAYNAA